MKKIIFAILLLVSLPFYLNADTIDDIANSYIPADKIVRINGREPESASFAGSYVIRTLNIESTNDFPTNVNCTTTKNCTLIIYDKANNSEQRTYDMTLEYNDPYAEEIYTKAEEITKKLKTLKEGEDNLDVSVDSNYILSDLSLINMILTEKYGSINIANYIPELMEIFKDNNYRIMAGYGAGEKGYLAASPGPGAELWYENNNIPVSRIARFSIIYYSVIYINEDTPDTNEAYIEAAIKRLNESFPQHKFEMEFSGELPADEEDIEWNIKQGYKGGPKKIFILKADGKIIGRFGIIKNNDYVYVPSYEKEDKNTGVSISTPIGNIPADTIIKVKDLTEVKEVVETVKEKILTPIHKIIDISLYSESKNDYITKLETGLFQVKINLGKEYIGRKISAYYIKDNGEIEEHKITMDENGNATFETDHFSRYIIADASEENIEVPKTLDNIESYIIISIISLISLIASLVCLKSKRN